MSGPAGILASKYQIDRELSDTPDGAVLLAHQVGPAGMSRSVVIRTLAPEAARDPQRVDQFLRAARLEVRLAHPNLVRVYDFGEDRGTYFTVHEHLEGETLAELQQAAQGASRALLPGFVAAVGGQACAGLAFAHAANDEGGRPAGVIHGALSLASLFASHDGLLKILDFGAPPAPSRNADGALAPCYRSPEQCANGQVDARSDLFSLGIALWELAVGRRLVGGNTPEEQARWVCQAPAPAIRTLDPQFPERLALIIERALLIDSARQYPGASAMGRDLDAFLAQSGTNAIEEVRAERIRRELVAVGAPLESGAAGPPVWMTGNLDPLSMPPTVAPTDAPDLEIARPVRHQPTQVTAPPLVRQATVPTGSEPPVELPWRAIAGVATVVLGGAAAVGHFAFRPPSAPPPAPAPEHVAVRFHIDGDPPGSELWLDGQPIGKTPYEQYDAVPPGEHNLRITHEGYASETRHIQGGVPYELTVALTPVLLHAPPVEPPPKAPPKTVLWPLAGPQLPKVKTSSN